MFFGAWTNKMIPEALQVWVGIYWQSSMVQVRNDWQWEKNLMLSLRNDGKITLYRNFWIFIFILMKTEVPERWKNEAHFHHTRLNTDLIQDYKASIDITDRNMSEPKLSQFIYF